jgi:hypothetical protein
MSDEKEEAQDEGAEVQEQQGEVADAATETPADETAAG